MIRPSRPGIPRNNPRSRQKIRKVGMSYWIARIILETGWTNEEIKKCPIPLFYALIETIGEMDKEKSESGM